MVRWLYSLFRAKYDLEIPERYKQIYSYFDGTSIRKEDPVVLYRAMMEVGPELDIDIRVAFTPFKQFAKDAAKAHNNMVAKLHSIFRLKPLAEGGLTDMECVELLNHFLDYCTGTKRKYESVVDMTGGSIAQLMGLTGRTPTYQEVFGFWLNRKRIFYRNAAQVMFGIQVALGFVDPGMNFYESMADGHGEALKIKAVVEMARRNVDDGGQGN